MNNSVHTYQRKSLQVIWAVFRCDSGGICQSEILVRGWCWDVQEPSWTATTSSGAGNVPEVSADQNLPDNSVEAQHRPVGCSHVSIGSTITQTGHLEIQKWHGRRGIHDLFRPTERFICSAPPVTQRVRKSYMTEGNLTFPHLWTFLPESHWVDFHLLWWVV